MTPEMIGWMDMLVKSFGPIGSMGLLMVLLVAYFYRRDFLKERRNGDRLAALVDRSATASERLAQTIDRLGEWIKLCEESRAREITLILDAVRKSRE